MKERLNVETADPKAYRAVLGLENYVQNSGLEPGLLHLIKLRASQVNGCAFCVDMHSKEALADGESQQRLNLLCVWRESPLYTERERAALEWTEAVTLVSENHVPDDVYERVLEEFPDEELVKLTMAVAAINTWNRLAISFRKLHPIDEAARKAA